MVARADPRHAFGKLFSELADVRLTQNLFMIEINLVNLNSGLGSGAPPHLRIVDVVNRLFRAVEENHGTAEPQWSKVLGPVGIRPVRSRSFLAAENFSVICCRALIGG